MGIEDFIGDKRAEILRIMREYGAHNLRVFGSVARGEATHESDIDFLVSFDPDRSLMDHAGLQIALEELLGRRVEVASDIGLKPEIEERILREAIAL